MVAATPEAYQLIHEGALAFADMEERGIRIDMPYLRGAMTEATDHVKYIENKLRTTDLYQAWQRTYGDKTNLDSHDQLGRVLYGVMKYPICEYTDSGKPSTDVSALEKIDNPAVRGLVKRYKLMKLNGTYYEGLLREVEGEYLHPFFNLHTVETMRSSSSDPNFQNVPIRDPEIGKKIRQCFIPRLGRRLVEMDYSAIEVCIAACYHRDPTMLKYIAEGYDMHRDMAAECYLLPKDKVPKAVRQQVKALFVFAEFYGDYYVSVAEALWEAIDRHKLTTADGVPLKEHLAACGITKPGAFDRDSDTPQPGSFEAHIKRVEDNFWGKRFPVYNQWRRDWYDSYCKQGGFRTKTGFIIQGVYRRNFVINAPVQGSAFHCLLWSIIRINKELKRRGMGSMLIGQIHDSLLGDVVASEMEEFCRICKNIMVDQLRAAWPWIVTPLKVEVEATDIDQPWSTKQPVTIAA